MRRTKDLRITGAFAALLAVLICSLVVPASALAADDQLQQYKANAGRITIEVDPRVELMSIVFRLAGNPEYNEGTLRPYVKAIEKHFGDFDNHPAVKMAAELRNTNSMSCDGPMSLAVHIDCDLRFRKIHEQWPATLDERWQFDEFFRAQGEIYQTGIDSCKDLIGPLNISEWLMEYFGVKDCGDLRLVLGFVNGFCNYGVRFEDDQTIEKYAIVGMRPFDPANTVIFRPMQIGTTMHEFCHSFANPIVDKYMAQLRPAGEKLFACAPAVRSQGYQKWESLMYETAVRACVGAFVRQKFEPVYTDYYLQGEVGSGFVWTEDMSNFLKQYEADRNKYPTFESFFPQLVKYLNDYSKKLNH